jgi:uncharacterized protein YjbJ (UPF0337 family)
MDNDRMKATAHELSDKIQDMSGGVADQAKTQVKKLSASAEGPIREAYGQARDVAREVSGGASAVAEGASALAGDAYDRSGRYLRDANRALGGQIGDNTLTALLLAGAAGYLLSYIVHSGR